MHRPHRGKSNACILLGMPESSLHSWLAENDHVITSAQATSIGLSAGDLCSAAARGELTRISRGCYADSSALQHVDSEARHRRKLAALLAGSGVLVASHTSAALVWDLPVSYAHLDRVHIARTVGRGTTRRYPQHTLHEGYRLGGATRHLGIPVVIPALAVLGTAFLYGVRPGVLAADAAQRAGLTTKAELCDWMDELQRTPGMRRARAAVHRSSATAESAGESRVRLILDDLSMKAVPQFTIRDRDGVFVARVDFYLPELGVVVEFDGGVKYGGADGQEALVAEKKREDAIRTLGYAVVRLTWADLKSPETIKKALWNAAQQARGM